MLNGDPMKRIPLWKRIMISAILLVMVLAVPALAGPVAPDDISNANPGFIAAAGEAGLVVTDSEGGSSGGLADSAWPKFGGPDLNNTGQSPFVGAQTNATKWIYATGGQFRSAVPVIGSDGTVYIGNYDKNVYAFNPDGTLKWTYTTGGYLSGPPAIGADGTIYIGNYDDNIVYALNPDGTLKWTYTTTGIFFGGPTIGPDGTIYIGNTGSDRSLYALNSV